MPVSTEITQEFINYSFYSHRRQKKRNHGIKQLIFLPQKMSKMKKFKISRQKSPDNVYKLSGKKRVFYNYLIQIMYFKLAIK